MTQFIAIDVETANADQGSICEIGLVCFQDNAIAWEWCSLVDPEGDFHPGNIRVHQITPDVAIGAPTWPQVAESLAGTLTAQTIVSHSSFDLNALDRASARYGIELPDFRWLDSHAVARQSWPQLGKHGLSDLCEVLDIELEHHSALSDARACGLIFAASPHARRLPRTSINPRIPALPARIHDRRTVPAGRWRGQADYPAVGAIDGPLRGHVVVFTGDFEGGKGPLSELAAAAGCDVEDNFKKKTTTILVVGTRNPASWGGAEKSQKHRQAEEAITQGRNVAILTEEEFRNFLANAVSSPPTKAVVC